MRPLNQMQSDADLRQMDRRDEGIDELNAAQAELKSLLVGMSKPDQMALVARLQAAGVAMPTKAQNARMTSTQRAGAVKAVIAAIQA